MNTQSSRRSEGREVNSLISELEWLLAATEDIEDEFRRELAAVHPSQRLSARNLIHYLALRRLDLRSLQHRLARLGLSSLGRIEAHVQATLTSVLTVLYRLARHAPALRRLPVDPLAFDHGGELLTRHADEVLGPAPDGRRTRIMVTAPTLLADDDEALRRLLAQGMDILRVNCAHDSPEQWRRMADRLRRLDHECLLSFDLAGPKLRTGPAAQGGGSVKFKPVRDAQRRVIRPAVLPLSWTETPVPGAIALSCELPARIGDCVRLNDARGKSRELSVVAVSPGGCSCQALASVHVVAGLTLTLLRDGEVVACCEVGRLPVVETTLLLYPGDLLDIVPGDFPARVALPASDGAAAVPACVSCELAELFVQAREGERICFDDGKIGAIVVAVAEQRLRVRIDRVVGRQAHLGAGKGINLPGATLRLPALTDADLAALEQIADVADLIGLSFVQTPRDVRQLLDALERYGAPGVGILLKIETRQAFENLPELLLAALSHTRVAVMVARGDLGVELGFERLAEVQEEILWLCEAAHVPVIWATQVLETLAKAGAPSRAEVTDAAMGGHAECVMLNKGPYIEQAVHFLSDVLTRIESHHDKKSSMLRRLGISAFAGHAGEATVPEASRSSVAKASPRTGA